MKLSKVSLVTYALLALLGTAQLGLIVVGALGLIFDSLLLVSGGCMALVSAYGINRRIAVRKLPAAAKIALGVGIIALLGGITLMTLVILALRNFH